MFKFISKNSVAWGLGLGFLSYKYITYQITKDKYVQPGFEFSNIPGLNDLAQMSIKFKWIEQFVKQHSSKDINVIMFKNTDTDGWSAPENKYINVDFESLLPRSCYYSLSDRQRKRVECDSDAIEAIIMHEIGHIEYNHFNTHKLLVPAIIATTVSLNLPLKYDIPLSCASIIIYLLIRRKNEYKADAYAVLNGYGSQLKTSFEISLAYNKEYHNKSMLVTKSGESLSDLTHPFLQNRIKRVDQLMDHN
jgi:Zn-dependent protease with chaperone function